MTLELSVVFPALVLFVFLSVQAGLWWHARQVALAAAQEGVEAAQVEGADERDGAAASAWFLARAGHMSDVTVRVSRAADAVTVTVTGDASRVVPFGAWPVAVSASGPLEQTIAQPDR